MSSINKKCRISETQFVVSSDEQLILKKFSILLNRKIFEMPLPTICPEERMRKLMSFRNERKLYKRKCSFSGKPMVSAFHENTLFPVYDNEYWWSDSWNALDYGKDFDFSRSFFDQFKDLLQHVPQLGVSVVNSENCHFNSQVSGCKDCYLNALIIDSQDCHHCYWGAKNVDLVDCFNNTNCIIGYENIDCHDSYEMICNQECNHCSSCYFSFQLENCKNCIGCSNLRNKEYYVGNKKVSPEEFQKQKEYYLNGNYDGLEEGKNLLEKLKKESFHNSLHNISCDNVSGDHLRNCKNSDNCFDGMNSEDCKNSISFNGAKDVYDCYAGAVPNGELLYNVCVGKNCYNVMFSSYVINCNNVLYSNNCHNCSSCFGCCGLVGKKYCILNKQYTKEEYESFLTQITEHMEATAEWGQFFPSHLSLFSYNETVAHESYPLSKDEAKAMLYDWKEESDDGSLHMEEQILFSTPIKQIQEKECNIVLYCEETGKPYQIQLAELAFYKKMSLPLPRKHPNQRHLKRLKMRNARKLFFIPCSSCGCKLQTSYDDSENKIVCCDDCYLEKLL